MGEGAAYQSHILELIKFMLALKTINIHNIYLVK